VSLPWENPVARHSVRLLSRGWIAAMALLLVGAGILGALLQRFGMEREIYASPSRFVVARWLMTTLIAELAIVAPWAAVRGAMLWTRLVGEGQMDEYRRTRLSAAAIAAGALAAGLFPVLALVGVSCGLSMVVGGLLGAYSLTGAAIAHGLLLVLAVGYGALGMWLAGRVRYPSLAIPLALALLAVSIAGIAAVDPFLRASADPSRLIGGALALNPVTAIASALDTDILRFEWLYARLHTHEYFYVYPPVWQTAVLYAGMSGGLVAAICRRIARDPAS